jgi:hypothetical protein
MGRDHLEAEEQPSPKETNQAIFPVQPRLIHTCNSGDRITLSASVSPERTPQPPKYLVLPPLPRDPQVRGADYLHVSLT